MLTLISLLNVVYKVFIYSFFIILDDVPYVASEDFQSSDLSAALKIADRDSLSLNAKLKESFFKVMIGRTAVSECSSLHSFHKVQLASLSSEVVNKAYRSCMESGQGFALFLQPFIVDLVKRKLSLNVILNILMEAHNERKSAAGLPDFVLDLTTKDLIIATLEITPEKLQSKLASHYVGLGCPFPFFYELCDSDRSTRSITNFAALGDLLLVQKPPLVLSCGTASALGCGKTSLLQKLIESMKDSCVDVSLFDVNGSDSPCHSSSADLVFEKNFTFADFHGFTCGSEFRRTLATFAIVSSLSIVHVTESDINETTHVLKDDVRRFIVDVFSHSAAQSSPTFVIIRDTDRSSLCAPLQKDLSQLLQKENVAVFSLSNLTNFRNEKRQYGVLKNLMSNLEPYLTTKASKSPRFPPIENLHQIFTQLSNRIPVTIPGGISSLGRRLLNTLNAFEKKGGKLASLVFPLISDKTRLSHARGEEKAIRESIAAGNGEHTEKDLARNFSKQEEIEEHYYTCHITSPVKLFAEVIRERSTKRLFEFQQYLEMWKHDDVQCLYDKRREILKQIESVKKRSENMQAVSNLEKVAKQIAVDLDELDISIDTFWSEIMQLCDVQQPGDEKHMCIKRSSGAKEKRLQDQCGLDPDVAKKMYLDCVLDAYPMQLLQGNPLQMAGTFLQDVMSSLGADSLECEDLLVVSVIGAQSSAKSTLLNYLFGCGFSTRSGRCTKGLYASYMTTSEGQRLLILDSEGLFSIQGAGRVFDGQITIMAMACSDVVIINHKGEISSDLKDLLQVSLHAMDNLGVTKHKPKLAFVLRDQRDCNVDIQAASLAKLKSLLKEASFTRQRNDEELVEIDFIFLLRSAYSEIPKGERSVEVPSTAFSQEIFRLRHEIIRLAKKGCRIMDFAFPEKGLANTLANWYNHASKVWKNLATFGPSLLQFTTIEEIFTVKDLKETFNSVLAKVFENEENGYKARADKYLADFKQEINAIEDYQSLDKSHRFFTIKLRQLKDRIKSELLRMFENQSISNRFNHLRPSFIAKIQRPLDREHNLYLSSAQLSVDRQANRVTMAGIKQRLRLEREEILIASRYKEGISPNCSLALFEKHWSQLQQDFEKQLSRNFPKSHEIKRNVFVVFAEVADRMQFSEKYLLLIGAETARFQDAIDNFQTWGDRDWKIFVLRDHFISTKSKNCWKNGDFEVEALAAVREMRGTVSDVVEELKIMLKHQDFGHGIARSALEIAVSAIAYLETKLFSNHGLNLARVEFVTHFYKSLQAVTIEELMIKKEIELTRQRERMESVKNRKCEEIWTVVNRDLNDLAHAKSFTEKFCKSLRDIANKKVLRLRVKIRQNIFELFGLDGKKAAAYAYYRSFGEQNYRNVIKYCLDAELFLKKLFIERYEREKNLLVSEIELNIFLSKLFECLQEAAKEWLQNFSNDSSILEIWQFSRFLLEKSSESEFYRACSSCFPTYASYGVGQVFVKSFMVLIQNKGNKLKEHILGVALPKHLLEERDSIWEKLSGCSAKCPLCGAKCEGESRHLEPHFVAERHHVFPAFRGKLSWESVRYPSLRMCLSDEDTHQIPWQHGLVSYPNLDAFLSVHHDRWRPFTPNPFYSEPTENLKRCWVNCRKALLQHFNMIDKLPSGWEEAFSEPSKEIKPGDIYDILDELRN